jgi:hypothetical protein
MKRIELIFQIENLSFLYEKKSISWQDAEFTTKTNFSAELKIWTDEVEPEQIMESWKKLKERCEPFLIAMKYMGNRQITCTNGDYPTYYYEDDIFTPRNEPEAQILTQYLRGKIPSFAVCYGKLPALQTFGCSMTSHPLQLPQAIPFIPLCLRRLAATITLVDGLTNYPDLQLKLAYMVLEELVETKYLQDFKDIKNARNFVSHASCKGQEVLLLVNSLLPSAINPSGTSAKFDREKSDHLSFAATFARKAHQWAKNEFEDEVIKHGGCIF